MIHGKDYGIAYPAGITFADDPERVCLADFGFRPCARFRYEYDFHDQWQHKVRVEQLLPYNPHQPYPVCISGARAAPPEDCGDPRAFLALSTTIPFM